MDKKRILCFGDSNTWGYIPGSHHERYSEEVRYPKLLQSLLGSNFEVIEEGLNSRTLVSEDPRPGKEGRKGSDYILPCLDSHDPLDFVALMLGTNELKSAFLNSAEKIGELLEEFFIIKILERKSQFRDTTPKLIVIAPPRVNENTDYTKGKYDGAEEKSKKLAEIYKSLSEKHKCLYINGSDLLTGSDGVHMTEDSHKVLAERVLKTIQENN
ncbi:MAG: GDSL-type esterase/lipase family protein [Candidatus Gracilibacteria bacterium]